MYFGSWPFLGNVGGDDILAAEKVLQLAGKGP